MDEGRDLDDAVVLTPSEIQSQCELLDTPVLGFFKVEFTGNALYYMKRRSISKHEVLTAIRSPDEKGLPTVENRVRVRRNQNQRNIHACRDGS